MKTSCVANRSYFPSVASCCLNCHWIQKLDAADIFIIQLVGSITNRRIQSLGRFHFELKQLHQGHYWSERVNFSSYLAETMLIMVFRAQLGRQYPHLLETGGALISILMHFQWQECLLGSAGIVRFGHTCSNVKVQRDSAVLFANLYSSSLSLFQYRRPRSLRP